MENSARLGPTFVKYEWVSQLPLEVSMLPFLFIIGNQIGAQGWVSVFVSQRQVALRKSANPTPLCNNTHFTEKAALSMIRLNLPPCSTTHSAAHWKCSHNKGFLANLEHTLIATHWTWGRTTIKMPYLKLSATKNTHYTIRPGFFWRICPKCTEGPPKWSFITKKW